MIHAVVSVAACVIITALALRLLADMGLDARRAIRRRRAIRSEFSARPVSQADLPPGAWEQFMCEIAVLGELLREEAELDVPEWLRDSSEGSGGA